MLSVLAPTLSLDGTQFRCVVSNSAGSATSAAATLTVQDPPVITSAPSATFIAGQSNAFTVTATGSPAVSFSINSGSFPAWASLNATTGVVSGTPPDATGSPFAFVIAAGNAYQSVFQNFALTVQPASSMPVITLAPTSTSQAVGANATFTAAAAGTPAPALRWQRQAAGGSGYVDLAAGAPYFGVTSGTLSISGLTSAMNGDQFRVVASNAHGTATSTSATLSVLSGNLIATQPQSRSVVSGQPASFTVVPAGSGPHAYQWYRHGVPISGATQATYTIAAAARADADFYSVEVSSAALRTRSDTVRLLVAPTAYPGQVAPDPAFSVLAEAGGATVQALVALPDGRVLAAGDFTRFNGHASPYLVRLTAAGAVDTTWRAPVFDGDVRALWLLPDGRVLVAGYFNRVDGLDIPGLARLNADLTLDRAFRLDSTLGYLTSVARLSDGRIVVGGASPFSCYSAEGVRDTSYLPDVSISGFNLRFAPSSAGKLYVSGYISSPSNPTTPLTLARLNANGTLDTSFAPGTFSLGQPTSMLEAADGKLYVTFQGYSATLMPWGGFARFTSAGAIDTTFTPPTGVLSLNTSAFALGLDAAGSVYVAGGYGLTRLSAGGAIQQAYPTYSFGPSASGGPGLTSLVVRPDGAVWIGGTLLFAGSNAVECVLRFASGSTVPQAVGTVVNRIGTVSSILPDASGRVLLAGNFRSLNGTAAFNLARLTASGSVDSTFAVGSGPSGEVTQLLRLPDGKLLIRGNFTGVGGIVRVDLARLLADGTLDQSFNYTRQNPNWWIDRVVPTAAGKLLCTGFFYDSSDFNNRRALVRLNPDGTPDSTFASVTVGDGHVLAALSQPDGRTLVAGTFIQVGATALNRLARLTADGALDSSLAIGTGFDPAVPAGGNGLSQLALAPDNRVFVGGPFSSYNGAAVSSLVRLQADGSRDTTFNLQSGFLSGSVSGLHVQEDGRILAWIPRDHQVTLNAPPRLARLTATGALDSTFAVHGLSWSDNLSALAMGEGGQLYYALSTTGRIHRTAAASAPAVTQPPQAQTVALGGTLTLSVTVAALPAPTYQWSRNNTAIPGATAATYAVASATAAHAGSYTVTVSNSLGSVTSAAATVVVGTPPPTILSQPADVVVTSGSPATLTVLATGATRYQWLRNGFTLPGKTDPSLTIPAARRIDADFYSVQVFNDHASVESAQARLGVAPAAYPTVVAPDPAWDLLPENDSGSISAMLRLADGRVYLGGAFLRAGGVRRTNVLRLLADGTVDPSFQPPAIDNTVSVLAVQADGRLLIGGSFLHIDGISRPRLARLETDGRIDPSFNAGGSGPSATPLAVAAWPDGTVLVGGTFTAYNGTPVNRLAWLDRFGTLLPDSRNTAAATPNSAVNVLLAVTGNRIAVGGNFTAFGASPAASGLALLRVDGTVDPAFNTGGTGAPGVQAVVQQADGRLIVGGTFTSFGGAARQRLARLETTGAVDLGFDPGSLFSGTVSGLALDSAGRVIASGSFVGERSYVARLLTDGSLDQDFNATGLAATVQRVVLDGAGRVLIGGSFAAVDGSARYGIARLGDDGGFDSGFDLRLRGSVSVGVFLPQPDARMLLARSFSYLRGTAVPPRVARFDSLGNRDGSYNAGGAGPDNTVFGGHRLPDGRMMFAGSFTAYNGAAVGRLVRVDAQGARDTTFNPGGAGFDNTVNAIAQLAGEGFIYGGLFSTYNGTSRPFLALVSGNGALDVSWAPVLNGSVSAIAVDRQRRVVIVGSFTSVDGVGAPRIARLLVPGGRDASFAPVVLPNNTVIDVAIQPDGKILAAGSFTSVGSESRTGIIRYNPDGSLDTAFAPVLDGAVNSVLVQEDGRIVIRGAFTSVGGAPGTGALARLLPDGSPDPSFRSAGFSSSAITSAHLAMDDRGVLFVPAGTIHGLHVSRTVAAPAMLTQPVEVRVAPGEPATFTATAQSPVAAAYQWLFNGNPIPGANASTYTIPSVTAAHAGAYALRVTTGFGDLVSASAPLFVDSLPRIASAPESRSVGLGGSTVFRVVAAGVAPFTYQWLKSGTEIPGATAATLALDNLSILDAASYTVRVTNPQGSVTSPGAALTVLPNPLAYSARVTLDGQPVVAHFAVTTRTSVPKQLLIRAIGPGLAALGVPGGAGDPRLSLLNAAGAVVAQNDNWDEGGGGATVAGLTALVGGTPLAAGSRDAVLHVPIPPGAGVHSVRIEGVGGSVGTVLLELYDLDRHPLESLHYVALRGRASALAGPFVGALSITNSAAKKLLVRAVGTDLGAGALVNPRLRILERNTVVAQNDDWAGAAPLAAAAQAARAFPLAADSTDAAVLLDQRIGSGVYSAEVSPVPGTLGGEVLLEFHDLGAGAGSVVPPLVVIPPSGAVLVAGATATLRVHAIGDGPLAYQWRRDGASLSGATGSTYSASVAGDYTVTVSSAHGAATSPAARVTLVPAGHTAQHALVGPGYIAGGTVTVTGTIGFPAETSTLGWTVALPPGWKFVSTTATGNVVPRAGDEGTLGWAWSTLPAAPHTFTYTVSVPAGEVGPRTFHAEALVRVADGALQKVVATPAPLVIDRLAPHDADTNRDLRLSLAELTRVIELYNVRAGSIRTGAYNVATTATEDGFALDAARGNVATALARHHHADTDRDGRLNLAELLRVIQLYNHRSASVRTGQYHVAPGSEDGFDPGP